MMMRRFTDNPDDWDEVIGGLLDLIGEDLDREGLRDTPQRVMRAWRERLAGYAQDPAEILARSFGESEGYDQMVLLRGIRFDSTCEHHLMRFSGVAHVAYIPNPENPRVLGLSKMARLVDCFANRLTLQERITQLVANAIDEHLQPLGVGVVLVSEHGCIACRGVRKAGAECVTSALRGVLREGEARAEFFRMTQMR